MLFQKNKKARSILCIAGCLLLVQLAVSFLVTKLIYDSAFPRYDYTPNSYSQVTAPRQETSFFSGGNRLKGWLFDGEGTSLVVLVQGINSYPEAHYPIVQSILTECGRDVFIFDMTGSCASEGTSAVGFCQSVYDLNAALDHIQAEYDYDDIFLFGHSRGGYAACCVLADRRDIDGVIAVNSPNSAMEAVIGPVADRIGPIAYGNYPMLWLYQSILFDAQTVSRSAAGIIAQSKVPVLIIHAENDQTVPAERYSIYAHRDTGTGENTSFLLLPGDHNSVLYEEAPDTAGTALMDAAGRFFDSVEKGSP